MNFVVAGEGVKPRSLVAWMPHDRRLLSEPAERFVRDTRAVGLRITEIDAADIDCVRHHTLRDVSCRAPATQRLIRG